MAARVATHELDPATPTGRRRWCRSPPTPAPSRQQPPSARKSPVGYGGECECPTFYKLLPPLLALAVQPVLSATASRGMGMGKRSGSRKRTRLPPGVVRVPLAGPARRNVLAGTQPPAPRAGQRCGGGVNSSAIVLVVRIGRVMTVAVAKTRAALGGNKGAGN